MGKRFSTLVALLVVFCCFGCSCAVLNRLTVSVRGVWNPFSFLRVDVGRALHTGGRSVIVDASFKRGSFDGAAPVSAAAAKFYRALVDAHDTQFVAKFFRPTHAKVAEFEVQAHANLQKLGVPKRLYVPLVGTPIDGPCQMQAESQFIRESPMFGAKPVCPVTFFPKTGPSLAAVFDVAKSREWIVGNARKVEKTLALYLMLLRELHARGVSHTALAWTHHVVFNDRTNDFPDPELGLRLVDVSTHTLKNKDDQQYMDTVMGIGTLCSTLVFQTLAAAKASPCVTKVCEHASFLLKTPPDPKVPRVAKELEDRWLTQCAAVLSPLYKPALEHVQAREDRELKFLASDAASGAVPLGECLRQDKCFPATNDAMVGLFSALLRQLKELHGINIVHSFASKTLDVFLFPKDSRDPRTLELVDFSTALIGPGATEVRKASETTQVIQQLCKTPAASALVAARTSPCLQALCAPSETTSALALFAKREMALRNGPDTAAAFEETLWDTRECAFRISTRAD